MKFFFVFFFLNSSCVSLERKELDICEVFFVFFFFCPCLLYLNMNMILFHLVYTHTHIYMYVCICYTFGPILFFFTCLQFAVLLVFFSNT